MGKGVQLSELQYVGIDNLYVLPSGNLPPNPSELLGSKKMALMLSNLQEKFDYIIIDLPPVNAVSDALSLSKVITGMIVVMREDYTEKKELDHCLNQISFSNINILSVLINNSKIGRGTDGKYKKYKEYKNYSYHESDPRQNDD